MNRRRVAALCAAAVITVMKSGRVVRLRLLSAHPYPQLESCMAAVMSRLPYPPHPDGPTEIELPFATDAVR